MKKFKINSLRKSVTSYIITTMIIFAVIAVAIAVAIQQDRLKHLETIYHKQMHKNIEFITKHYKKSYMDLLKRLVDLGHIEKTLQSQDREKLYKYLKPKWEILKKQDKNLKILHIHLKDGTSFLRMHNPKIYGDQLQNIRPLIKKIHKEHIPLSGYETGKYGTTYRVLLPIFNKKREYLGAIEVGLHPNFLLEAAYEINGHDGFVFIKEDFLNKKNKKKCFEIDGYHIRSTIKPQMQKKLKYLTPELLKNCSNIVKNDKEYKTHIFVLKNIENKPKVKILLFQDMSNKYSKKYVFYLMFTIIILVILMIFIVKRVKKYQNSMIKIHKQQLLELKNKDKILLAQSKHAAMGEMISMIAHQWRQPISAISMEANNILADIELEIFEQKQAKECAKGVIKQTQELSKTIDDFRNFFKPQKEKEELYIKDIINNTLEVIGKSIYNSNIKISINLNSNKKIQTYPRELMQVLLNLLKNAKEIILEKHIPNGTITINVKDIQDNIHIEVCDNAGGIKKEIIKKIFDPYFTTKDKDIGTGLGLYMSKIIIQKHLNGNISAHNKAHGACFEITLPLKNK